MIGERARARCELLIDRLHTPAPAPRVKETCIQQGARWASSVARSVCGEQEYYEELVRAYRDWARVSLVGRWMLALLCVCVVRGEEGPCAAAAAAVMTVAPTKNKRKPHDTQKNKTKLYPYHLADYVARVLRLTPFRYYSDVLLATLKAEASYDTIPNFTVRGVFFGSCLERGWQALRTTYTNTHKNKNKQAADA